MSVSLWQRLFADHRSRHSVRTDLAIIGGGVAGLSAALWARKRGLTPLVIERHTLGFGASTRNAGFLMRGAADNYAAACRDYGPTRARELWRWSEDNLAILREWGIESLPSYRRLPSCLLALEESEAVEIRDSAELLARDGFEAHLIDSGDDTIWTAPRARSRPILGLVNPHDAVCNPAELIAHLASRLPEDSVLERAPVHTLEDHGEAFLVRTPAHDITASRVLICLNGYAGWLLPELADRIIPNRGQMLALRAPSARLDHAYYANHGGEYIRPVAHGLIAVGGCRASDAAAERLAPDEPTPAIQSRIEAFAADLLGGSFEVVHRWAGTMGFTPDGLPLIGPLCSPRLWVCAGFNGHGMSLAVRSTRAAIDAIFDGSPAPFPADRFDPE